MSSVDSFRLEGLTLIVVSGTEAIAFSFEHILDAGVTVCQLKFDGFADISSLSYNQNQLRY